MSPRKDDDGDGTGGQYGSLPTHGHRKAGGGVELIARRKNNHLLLTGFTIIICVVLFIAIYGGLTANRSKNDSSASTAATALRRLNEIAAEESTSPPISGCEVTVVIIRHCEKYIHRDDGDQHCSYLGYERAHFLPTLFGSRWPVPDKLFAYTAKRKGHMNFREIETLLPTSKKYSLEIDSQFGHDGEDLADHIFKTQMGSHSSCGSTVLICWKHSHIASLAQKLGCEDCPEEYPSDSFDQVWQLKYVYDVEGRLKMFGDTPNDGNNNTWRVYSTVTSQNFDPLQYSYKLGDYDPKNKTGSASWSPNATADDEL